ncbi:MAG: protein kinase [Tannerella sp.]|jgi:serine/threonine protein kinase|nr:protein kinase [Tannerella sp.]
MGGSNSKIAQRCDFNPGDRVGSRYIVEQVLGEGSFGNVYKVHDFSNNVYALKLMRLWEVHPEIRQQLSDRFEMEFQTGRINSRYLVQSLDYGTEKGNPYIVMEFCPQGDLLHLAQKKRPDYITVGRQILYGLRDLHSCGKVHRDLKPENVLIRDDGTSALTDFGIAGDRNKRMTERNLLGKPTQIFGTYAYMPPEQVNPKRGEATVLPTTDIFSFGVLMYQIITGILPFGRLDSENDLPIYIKRGREGDWDRKLLTNSRQGAEFARIIEGCLVPDFKNRLQTVDAVLALFPAQSSYAEAEVKISPEKDTSSFSREVKSGVLLRIMHGEEHGTSFRLNDLLKDGKRLLTMGRKDISSNNSIPLVETGSCYISRKHCTLEWDKRNQVWYIRDGQRDINSGDGWRDSVNGTYVNSSEVSRDGMAFYPGDIISVGDVKLRAEGY